MRGDKEIRRIALQVSIALSAGVFSIMPSVSAAPVLDHVVSGGAVVDKKTSPQVTDITSNTRNNVIDWKDFSVAKGESVRFDKGEKTNNYLNVVSGANTSQIDGAIKGGDNVYIVNPNGVVFGNSASVDVGSLYVSSRPLADVNYTKVDANGDMQPLADTASMNGGDIVNMGTVQANSVFVEGGNIFLGDVDRIKTADGKEVNNNVTIQTEGDITLGRSVSAMAAEEKANQVKASMLRSTSGTANNANSLGSNYRFTANNNLRSTGGISQASDFDYVKAHPDGSYYMSADVTVTGEWTPIGTGAVTGQDGAGNDIIDVFTGTFDGMYHTVSGIKVSSGTYGGLFGYTKGATISNVGVKNANITADYAGGIAGKAVNTTFTNVFNAGGDGSAIHAADPSLDGYQGTYYAGGIIGYAEGGAVSVAYNNAPADSGGIVGFGAGDLTINDAYDKAAAYGIIGATGDKNSDDVSVSDVFTTGDLLYDANASVEISGFSAYNVESTSVDDYSGLDISNSGLDNTTWRIYEGQTIPLLRAFLRRGGSAVTVNYSYSHGTQTGSNDGADLTAKSAENPNGLTYNGSYVTVTGNPEYDVTGIDTQKIKYGYDEDTNGVKNAKTKALFYTDQQGYDIIGGNVTMAKRKVTVDGADIDLSKVYDGEADVTEAFKTAFANSAGTGTAGGILETDAAYVTIDFKNDASGKAFSAVFADSVDGEGNILRGKDVGENKTVTLNGGLDIKVVEGADADKAAEIKANYEMDASSKVLTDNTAVKGTITPRTLLLNIDPSTGIDKPYDGSAEVSATYAPDKVIKLDKTAATVTNGAVTGDTGLISGDIVELKSSGSKAYYVDADETKNANAGAHDVLYTGIALDEDNYADAKNYVLKYRDSSGGEVKVEGEKVKLSGTINRRLILSDGFKVKVNGETKDATKEYDGEYTYTLPEGAALISPTGGDNDDTGVITADQNYLHFALKSSGSYFTDAAGNKTANATTNTLADKVASKVAYAIDVTADAVERDGKSVNLLKNYKIGTEEENEAGTAKNLDEATDLTVSGNGTITRRALNITADGVTGIVKEYDGNKEIATTDENYDAYTTMGNKVKYAANSKELVGDDTFHIDVEYSDKKVYRENGVVVEDGKNVNFQIYIEGDAAGNYTLNGENANAEQYTADNRYTLTGAKGTITPLKITPTFNKITKTYDGSKAINTGNANASTYDWGDQLVGTDAVTLNYSTDIDHAYFNSANVAEANKVTYTGFSLDGDDKGNYELESTTVTGEGQIDRRLILSDSFKVNGAKASKEYDGTWTYTLASGATLTSAAGATGNTGVVAGDVPHLHFSLSSNGETYFTEEDGETKAQDVAKAKMVAYAVDATADTGYDYLLGNYKLGTTASSVNLDDNAEGLHVTGEGEITRRALKITAEEVENINKPYDKTDTVKNENGSDYFTMGKVVKYDTGSKKLVSDEGIDDGTTWNITATYNGADVYRDPTTNEVVDNGKAVTFKVYIDGDAASNYTLNGNKAESYSDTNRLLFTGSTGTISPLTITPTFGTITKTYTGTTSITDGNANASSYELPENLDGDAVTLNYTDAYFDSPNAGEATKVTYTGLSLDGAKQGNYELASDTGEGGGKINKYLLENAPNITFKHVNKEYDGTNAVVYSRNPSEDDPKKFITATINTGSGTESLGFDLVSAAYEGSYVNSNDGQNLREGGEPNKATFTIKFSSKNYEFSEFAFSTESNFIKLDDGSYQYSDSDDNATITPRKITVTLGDTLSNTTDHYVTKTYDADNEVEQNITRDLFNFGADDILTKADGKTKDNVYLSYNNTAQNAIKAEYDNKNAGNVKEVTYYLELTGDDANNYVLNTDTLTGEGDIQKAKLIIDENTFDPVEKVYDGNANVTTLTADKVHLTGVKKADGSNETIHVDNAIWNGTGENTNKIIGTYDSKNVKWIDDTDVEDFQGVTYSNLQNALEFMTDGDGEKISTNYELDIRGDKHKGKITAYEITQKAERDWTPVTREYNAGDNVDGVVYQYDPENKKQVGDTPLNTNDILKLKVKDKDGYDINVDYEATANFDDKDVSDERQLKYAMDYVNKKVKDSNGYNYKLSETVYNDLQGTISSGKNNQITKRKLSARLDQDTDVTKVYGTATSTDNFKLDTDDAKVLEKDGYIVNDVIQKTATYKLNGVAHEDATMDPQAYGGTNTNTLTIDYTLATTADAKNYEVVTPTAQANGDIERRQVQVTLVNGTVDEKDYDATTKMADGTDKVTNPNNKRFTIDPASGSDYGLVAGESITVSGATAEFADEGNVNRAKDGTVIAQSVSFSDFTKEDGTGKASNYYITTKELTGSGVINPLAIGVAVKQAPSKTYDGNTNIVGETYLANSNLDIDETNALALRQSVANSIAIDGTKSQYKDKNAGEGNKDYAYVINLSNKNYKLVLNDAYDQDFSSAKGGLQATIADSDGTIKKRAVSVNKIADMTKEYDGTTAGTENAVANVSLNNAVNGMNTGVVSGDDVKLSAVATYDNPNAGKSADSDELQTHKVKYTLNLSNSNYELADDAQVVYGNGYITRQGLVVTVNPASMNAGEALPKFTGTVTGFISSDQSAYRDFVKGLSFQTEAGTTTTSPGQYAVYGWYRGNKAGLAGLNYTFVQDAANDTALTVNYVNNNTGNPDTKITPSSDIYQQISKDMNSGFGDNGAAAIEYQDKGGNVIGTENIGSGEIHGTGFGIGTGAETISDKSNPGSGVSSIGIVGGDIVNMEGVDAAGSANIEVSGDGTTVNLEVFSIEGNSANGNSAAEITNADGRNGIGTITSADGTVNIRNNADADGIDSMNGTEDALTVGNSSVAQIEITDGSKKILDEENEDKAEKKEKEGEIAIKSSDGDNDDEIELTVEDNGVNVA